jgi:hypothetical protein
MPLGFIAIPGICDNVAANEVLSRPIAPWKIFSVIVAALILVSLRLKQTVGKLR